tara:strand:+ start:182 stop:628 length:447 start_codon:yes stop_codon:yes gene_type:complete
MKINSLLLFSLCIVLNSQTVLSQEIQIIPRPLEVISGSKTFKIDKETQLVFDNDTKNIVTSLQNYFKNDFGFDLKSTNYQSLKKNFIVFKVDENLADEGYELTITEDKILICAKNTTGWFYGTQTLMQLCSYNADFSKYEKRLTIKEV